MNKRGERHILLQSRICPRYHHLKWEDKQTGARSGVDIEPTGLGRVAGKNLLHRRNHCSAAFHQLTLDQYTKIILGPTYGVLKSSGGTGEHTDQDSINYSN